MIRLFNVYYPTRILVLVAGEGLIVCASFLLAALIRLGQDSALVLGYEYGFYKILGITAMVVLCLHYFDLYDLQRIQSRQEIWFRLLVVLGIISFLLAGLGYLFPTFILGNNTFVFGLFILTVALFAWRGLYDLLIRLPYLRERVYVLGSGDRATRLVETLRARPELGMEVVEPPPLPGGDTATGNAPISGTARAGSPQRLPAHSGAPARSAHTSVAALERDALPAIGDAPWANLIEYLNKSKVSRVIVALGDRRGTTPVRELLELRMRGMRVEEATAMVEKVSGKIEVEGLYPSALIFSEGFAQNMTFLLARRLVSLLVSLLALMVLLPLFPLIALAIRLTSEGPVFYRQKRVGRNGVAFTCYKFRTMRVAAETETGPKWATDDDPRITGVGKWLRRTRLDETPQLWNVLRGEMGFVGPRPERPEFVEWLIREIPYYHLRHVIRPGITGWAQVRYQYGASVEESREKLKYDLYYIKHMSLSLDLLILLYSMKVILLGRGAR